MAVAGMEDVSDCYIGFILGTGSNACYVETFDADTMPKCIGKEHVNFDNHSHVIINYESGAFGEGGELVCNNVIIEQKIMTLFT